MTAVWGIVGLLCSAGVILAVLDPSLTGSSSATSSTGAPDGAPQDDDGFVAPPQTKPAQQEQPAPIARDPVERLEHSARFALADAQIARHLAKLRKEREARTAAKLADQNNAKR